MAEKENSIQVLKGPLRMTDEVQTSYPLLSIIQGTRFSVNEIKLLATYLSRINSADDSADVVTFTLKEFQDIMGLPNLKPSDMAKYIAGISKRIKVPGEYAQLIRGNFKGKKNGYGFINLFRACFINQDDFGEWVVEMACSEEAKILFFYNPEQIHYIHCALANIAKLSHSNSCYLYLYLLTQLFRGSWVVGLEELRNIILQNSNSKSYEAFKYFNNEVLKKSVAEINEKTDICCDYKLQKRGRTVVAIEFTAKRKKKQKGLSANTGGDDYDQLSIDYVDPQTPAASMIATISGGTFTEEETQLIEEALYKKIPNKDEHGKRQDLFRDSYYQLQEAEKKNKQNGKKINNRCSYLIRTIENARDSVWSPEGKGNFSPAFEQFFAEYPLQVQKASAYDAYKKVLHDNKDLTPENLIQAARLYRAECENMHTEKKYIMYPANFLVQNKKYPNGKFAEYLERAEIEAAAEAQRRAEEEAREADPEHQAEEERIRKEIQKRLKTETEPTDSNKEKALEELMDYWREIKADDAEWAEEKSEEVYAGIEARLQTSSTKEINEIKAVLNEAASHHGIMPRFDLVGTI